MRHLLHACKHVKSESRFPISSVNSVCKYVFCKVPCCLGLCEFAGFPFKRDVCRYILSSA